MEGLVFPGEGDGGSELRSGAIANASKSITGLDVTPCSCYVNVVVRYCLERERSASPGEQKQNMSH